MDIQFPFSPLFLSIGLLLLFVLISVFKSFNSRDSNKNLPPQPWKLPLVGHIHHLLGAPPHQALRNIARKLGPIVRLQLGQVSAIIISSPTLAKEIMKNHDLSFANRAKVFTVEIVSYNYKDIAFTPYGDYWRQMRKICVLELLSARKVQSFRSIREQESWDLVDSIATQRSQTINLSDKIFTMINTIVTRLSVGSRCKDQAVLLALIQEAIELSGGFDVSDLFPSITILPLITGTRKKILNIHNRIDVILESIISEHRESRVNRTSDHANEEDLVDVLLRLKDEGGLEFPLSFDNIKGVILNMFVAGSDTSSVTIEWAMSELIKNPRVMKKAQDELRHVLKGKTKIHESDIEELDYLKLVIKETLRLHPPLPFLLPRECRESCEIGGFHIPVKTKVLINTWMIGRDPDYWIDPQSFIPERFSENSVNMMGTNFEYLPFGAGRRMCPAMLLGLANVELPLAMLLYHFDWELPNGQTYENFDMFESSGATLKRKNDLLLVSHPYNTKY
ncbi:putative oxidoreductase [Helianthus annuus]|uniref:Oxidoreductase n=1 Tax=Helianthus annuus TaxID=4232 RepID=A0A251TD74_HELAN|nr:cytochrome P450 71AV8 [Helianthus annuus]KAF5783418.1 putative oxidoreductase [Helianthus annuus]KAJ0502739.1 putative oxidoreductase [Helianthus annuus]KAJ0518700.1 putative oxidoreductase [Helianthus annuus]KAJ0686742.1 putative oxidoreductase [Helianthus annuus]KAJ0690544.1 putative oxidoreductase [Helianthus annuus]